MPIKSLIGELEYVGCLFLQVDIKNVIFTFLMATVVIKKHFMKNVITLTIGALFIGFQIVFGQTYQNIEYVEYDPIQNRFLVSNQNNIIQRNTDGSLDYFGNGASASYGMEVMNNILFAIDGPVKGYDLNTGDEIMSIDIPGAGFLNGMASDGISKLYVTDFTTTKSMS